MTNPNQQHQAEYRQSAIDNDTIGSSFDYALLGQDYQPRHIKEFQGSGIDPELVALNIDYLEGERAIDALLWGLDTSERRNDGRVRDKWLTQYAHVRKGGLAFYGVDPLTGERTECLCFKPDYPISPDRKYENPPKTLSQAFYPAVTYRIWELTSERFSAPLPPDITIDDPSGEAKGFWAWVIDNNIPVIPPEGNKKAMAAISEGFPAVGITGIWNGVSANRDENGQATSYSLIPTLLPIATPDRVINIAFDRDKKASANKDVIQARSVLAKLLIERGCKPFSIPWDNDYKGLDDPIAGCGIEALEKAIEKAEALTGEKPNFKQKPAPNILAEKIAKELKNKLLFDVGGKLWRYYNGGVWQEKTIEEIERYFYERVCLDVPENIPSYIDNIVKVAKWKLLQPKWDEVSGLEYIPFKNGVWDVKNRQLLPHSPDFLLTWKLERDYPSVIGLEYSKIDKFLDEVTKKKGKDAFKFRYEGMVAIASNDPIFLGDSSYGLSRRLITIPFKYQVPVSQRRDLETEFTTDLPAFTSYLLSLDNDWVKSTLLGSSEVAEIRETEWDLVTRTDSIAGFYDDILIFDPNPNVKTSTSLLYAAYQDYCKASGLSAKSIHKFTPDLVELCSIKLGLAVSAHRSNKGRNIIGLRFRLESDACDACDASKTKASPPLNLDAEQGVTLVTLSNSYNENNLAKEEQNTPADDKKLEEKAESPQSVTSVTSRSGTELESVTPSDPKRHQATQASLKIGDRVRYVGGILRYKGQSGEVTKINGPNIETTFTTRSHGSITCDALEVISVLPQPFH